MLDWKEFDSLPGSKNQNLENLCRGLMRLHYGRFGKFVVLANHPGVEFHIELFKTCSLGSPPRCFGWQCKLHTRTQNGNLRASSKKDIEESLRTTERLLPGITDWVLWTPYTLSKSDQGWFGSLSTPMDLHLWNEETVETYLSGDGLNLRGTYFGELILTPEELARRHQEAIQPIRERWLEPVHQSVDVERIVRRMLGEQGSWNQMIAVGRRLRKAAEVISDFQGISPTQLDKAIEPFVTSCAAFADTLLHFHEILGDGDLEIIQQKLSERKTLIDTHVRATPRRLRTWNLPIALDATNALDDMRIAQKLLDEVEEFLGVGLVAVLADAGGGKTQMAAQLTAPQDDRPAGIFLHGRDLHRGQTLDDLARHFSINGTPVTSMERLLASLDAAGKRSSCRLPLIIDGLNEAENPKDWKAPLAILSETVRRFPNVLVVCTLRTGEHRRDGQVWAPQPQTNARESFAVMAIPDGVRRIESEGFGGDVDDAIEKYFNHFKINPGNAEIPVEFLQHPLTLRIYCEVTNPKRESVVKVDYFPASLTPLFEKYVANACERISQMANLSYPYTTTDLELAVYQLGFELWKAKKRKVNEADYKITLSNGAFQWDKWDSNIVNLFAQEGIVFRNPGSKPGQYSITPVHDALGGYIVANFLLAKHKDDLTFEWLKHSNVIKLFASDDSHELAFDIFRSLVTLVPRRMHGSQLWKEAPNPLGTAALRFTTELEPKYLDKDTVAALLALFGNNPTERTRLFSRLQRTRGASNHSLNSEFLDSALRAMSVAERDLSWTEWIRKTRAERLNDLLAIELRWKENPAKRTASDRLRVKWVMWLLTSTDHELRDVATRALYSFGHGDPAALFGECLNSLKIDDPYVPERMLAASYGVSMYLHARPNERHFREETLPKYAKSLYDKMFARSAPHSTTHVLMRDFAKHSIDIALLYHATLLNKTDLKRITPPFSDGGIRKWGRSKDLSEGEYRDGNAPLMMDFENYTLGTLVPERANYDYKDRKYQIVRANIFWRIYDLGYSLKTFGEVDKQIARGDFRRGEDNAGRIDRYGKKYSWIAYYELYGHRLDKGYLKSSWRHQEPRPSEIDIDPSFPDLPHNIRIISKDLLGKRSTSLNGWIQKGKVPDFLPYLKMKNLDKENGPWIPLDGFMLQEEKSTHRRLFAFLRSFMIGSDKCDSFLKHLETQYLGNRWLVEIPEDYYTFAGEVPWGETFSENGRTCVEFTIGHMINKVKQPRFIFRKKGKEIPGYELSSILRKVTTPSEDKDKFESEISKVFEEEKITLEKTEVVVDQKKPILEGFDILIPVRKNNWESYHSATNPGQHSVIPAKEIALTLCLKIGLPNWDLYDSDWKRASITTAWGESWQNNNTFCYLRQDLLDKYLKEQKMKLVWALWGEREARFDFDERNSATPAIDEYSKVFSKIYVYENGKILNI